MRWLLLLLAVACGVALSVKARRTIDLDPYAVPFGMPTTLP